MDTYIAKDNLHDPNIEKTTVTANDRQAECYEIDPQAEKKLLRKIDLRVVPILWLLFLLAFLDRTNIGMVGYGLESIRITAKLCQVTLASWA